MALRLAFASALLLATLGITHCAVQPATTRVTAPAPRGVGGGPHEQRRPVRAVPPAQPQEPHEIRTTGGF
jgi:hypothetical protein